LIGINGCNEIIGGIIVDNNVSIALIGINGCN